jgi:hypothetical protein
MTLNDGVWRYSTVQLRGQPVPRLTGMQKIRIQIPYAWVPAKVAPRLMDPRTLGLQIGEPVMR